MKFIPLPGKTRQAIRIILLCLPGTLWSQDIITVKPTEIDDVLVNPGMGFMTFQRFDGDALNEGIGWTEGFPIEYPGFDGSLEMEDHPMTSIAYFRVYWRFLEPTKGEYLWAHFDRALQTARERKQQLLIRTMGRRYDGHRDLHAVDLSITGKDKEGWYTLGRINIEK